MINKDPAKIMQEFKANCHKRKIGVSEIDFKKLELVMKGKKAQVEICKVGKMK